MFDDNVQSMIVGLEMDLIFQQIWIVYGMMEPLLVIKIGLQSYEIVCRQ